MKQIFFILTILLLLVGCQGIDRTISTTGTSEISAKPDLVSILFSVETTGKTAAEASLSNNEIVSNIQKELETETQYLNVYEDFDYTNNGRKSKGFKATHSLKIKTSNFDEIGNIIDKGFKLGATSLTSVNFELSDDVQKKVKVEALKKASKDAKTKAEAIASGMDVRLGKIVSVSDVNYNYYPYAFIKSSDVAIREESKIKITPKNVKINAQVKVIYSLK